LDVALGRRRGPRVRRTILTNLLWAFGYNLITLTAAALGLLQPILAAAVMAGSTVLVVMNSMRLQRLLNPNQSDIAIRHSIRSLRRTRPP
jgi:Cu2+-exporting ATPase